MDPIKFRKIRGRYYSLIKMCGGCGNVVTDESGGDGRVDKANIVVEVGCGDENKSGKP